MSGIPPTPGGISQATVTITDVVPDTVSIKVRNMQVGDHVFDVWGGEHRVWKIVRFVHVARIFRDDERHGTHLNLDDTITVRRQSPPALPALT